MKTTPKDHLPPKPTKAQTEELQKQLAEAEAEKQKEFVDKYNALCMEYGYSIAPQVTVQLQKLNK
jgi:hypothetical protein